MKRRFLAVLFLLSSKGALAVCPPNTPVIKVDGRVVNYSYVRYVESAIPGWAMKKFYSGIEGKEKLLNKILERQLILQYYRDKGFFRKPEIAEHLQRFRIKTLSSLYLTEHIKQPRVTEAEVDEAIKRYYRGKRITPELRRSVKVNLEAEKISSERERIISSVKSHLKVVNLHPKSPNDVVAVYKGRRITYRDVKPLVIGEPIPSKLKRALETYTLYLEALKEGLDRSPAFKNRLLSFEENLAVSSFEREVLNSIKVSDGEIKDYYLKHREEFKTPASAKVLIFVFPSENEAKRALKSLKSGKSMKESIPEPVFSTGKEWTVLSNDKNNPVSMLVFSSKEKFNLLNMPDGRTLLIVVEKRKPSTYLLLGDVYSTIKNKLKTERAREVIKKKLEELKKRYSARVLPSSLRCFGKEDAD